MEPKRIKSSGLRIPRPERYEWEEFSNSPPPSTQNILQLFDTSSIVRDHPRKYQLLLAQEEGEGQKLPQADDDKQSGSGSIQSSSSPSGSFKKTSSLVEHARQVVKDDKVQLQEESASLSAIAQKYIGFPQQTGLQDRRFSLDDRMFIKDPVPNIQRNSDFMSRPSTSYGVQKTDKVCDPSKLVPVSVQPRPRRFLGFGGYFKPLPETVLLPKDTATSHRLTDEINKQGITADTQGMKTSDRSMDAPESSCKKKAPTSAEINMWAPSGM